jgi:hypothetical protein
MDSIGKDAGATAPSRAERDHPRDQPRAGAGTRRQIVQFAVTGHGRRKAVLLCLDAHAKPNGESHPHIDRIVAGTDFCRRVVQRAIAELVEAGFLVVELRRTGRGTQLPSIYTIDYRRLFETIPSEIIDKDSRLREYGDALGNPSADEQPGAHPAPGPSAHPAPGPGAHQARTGRTSGANGVQGVRSISEEEPIREQIKEQQGASAPSDDWAEAREAAARLDAAAAGWIQADAGKAGRTPGQVLDWIDQAIDGGKGGGWLRSAIREGYALTGNRERAAKADRVRRARLEAAERWHQTGADERRDIIAQVVERFPNLEPAAAAVHRIDLDFDRLPAGLCGGLLSVLTSRSAEGAPC